MLVDARPGCVEHDKLVWRGRKRAVKSDEMRRVYEEMHGPITAGEHVHHLCGNPWCAAKDHLATYPIEATLHKPILSLSRHRPAPLLG